MLELGADGPSFDTIVASGHRGAPQTKLSKRRHDYIRFWRVL